MSPKAQRITTGRSIVEDVLGREMTREIWTSNYEKAIPISIQDFDLSAVLPAVFYMFRWDQRRGKGKFLSVFGSGQDSKEMRRSATIERVADRLAEAPSLEGFPGEVQKSILGDLLLCFCLENRNRALGRNEQIQRVAPAHYMSSWVDLPERVTNLRNVPEMMVAMLADQKGEFVQHSLEGKRTWFAVGRGFSENVLLRAFNAGIQIHRELSGEFSSRTSDRFIEETPVGVDQLLMIRLAQTLGEAPDKVRGGEGEQISNQRPIAERAAHYFSEDIRRFIRSYAGVIPRQALLAMLESCMAVGLATIFTSVIRLLLGWAETGEIRKNLDQKPVSLFVDCSNGIDIWLRAVAEQSFDDFLRWIERFPVILMGIRLLDRGTRINPRMRKLDISTKPYATDWLNLLGDVLHKRHEQSNAILYAMEEKATILADKLREEAQETSDLLENVGGYPNPVWRLAEALTVLQGRENTQQKVLQCIDSCLHIDRPSGLAVKRRVRQSDFTSRKKTREIRSITFTDSILDYLVHLHLLPGGSRRGMKLLSYKEFLRTIRDRYGFYVDESPPGMTISNGLLQANRAILERRLRDLGLLSGVNDAEAMKRLKPRFTPREEEPDAAN